MNNPHKYGNNFKYHLLAIFSIFGCLLSYSQNILISQGGAVSVTGNEVLYDAGGPTGNDTNQDYIITLVPAIAGQRVYLDFSEFNLYFDENSPAGNPSALVANGDYLDIFDGSSIASNQLCELSGNFGQFPNGNYTNGMGVKSDPPFAAFTNPGIFTSSNALGTLTIRFRNFTGSSTTKPGFKAFVKTYTPAGSPGCFINLSGTSSCLGQPITLTAIGDVISTPINNDFNNGQLGPNWVPNFTPTFTNPPCAATGRDGITNTGTFLWVANVVRPRTLQSVSGLDVRNGGTISFDYRQSRQGESNPCEGSDRDQFDNLEGIYMQYSLDSGTTWTTFNYIYPREDNNGPADFYQGTGTFVQSWRKIIVPIPTAAKTINTKFRWHQEKATSDITDNWGLDNIVVGTPLNKTITITNLTTGVVLATATQAPLAVTVNPTTAVTYRATITDGTTTCFSDFTVNPKVTPTFTQVATICSGATLSALPTTSTNAVTGTWSPAVNNLATTTYTFTPTDIVCNNTATMTVTVSPRITPTFTQVAAICSGASLSALPTTSNNSIAGTWSPAINNTATTTYTFTPTDSNCNNTATMTISVTPKVTPTFTQVNPICSGATLNPLPTTSSNGITGAWSPAVNNLATTTYTFTPTDVICNNSATMTITVTPKVTPTFTQVATICSGAAVSALPTTSTNAVTGTWSPAVNNTATTTYTFTPTDSNCNNTATMTITVTPRINPTFTQVATICSGATLNALPTTSINGITGTWSPAVNNLATTTYTFTPIDIICNNSAAMTISVTPKVTPTFTQVNPICSGATLNALPTTSTNAVTGTWSPAINNLATTTYTFTPNDIICNNSVTMTITVTPKVTPTFTQVAAICSGAAVLALPTTSTNAVTGTWSPAVNNLATTTYTFTPTDIVCNTIATMTITVTPKPILTTSIFNATICSGAKIVIDLTSSLPGTTYSWGVLSTGIAGASPGSGSQISQTLTTMGLTSGNVSYIITPTQNSCVGNSSSVIITVNPTPEIFGVPSSMSICSGENTQISLTPSITGTTFAWTVIQNGVTGAYNGTGESIIQSIQTLGSAPGIVSYAVTPTLNTCVGNTITISVLVNPLPILDLSDGIICKDSAGNTFNPFLINTGLSSSNFEFEWYLNGILISGATNNSYLALQNGMYSVQVKNTITGCIAPNTLNFATVTAGISGLSVTAQVSDAFSSNPLITVTVSGGVGVFEYALDNGLFQLSNIFTGVEPGLHTIIIRDANGCTDLSVSVLVIGYPTYFTPNGDSFHDYWNIIGFDLINKATIFIFDRYGKLIKQINPLGSGWDGNYNGNPLPSSDYWFVTYYFDKGVSEYREFKSHFTLKR